MVGRDNLPSETIRKVAGFVSDTLLEQLTSRNDLDDSLRDEIRSKIEERLSDATGSQNAIELNNAQSIAEAHEEFRKGRVPAHRIMRHLNDGDFSFVVAVIALMSGSRHESLANAIQQNNAQAIVSASWKSGLDPYLTETIQKNYQRSAAIIFYRLLIVAASRSRMKKWRPFCALYRIKGASLASIRLKSSFKLFFDGVLLNV